MMHMVGVLENDSSVSQQMAFKGSASEICRTLFSVVVLVISAHELHDI